MAMAVAPSTRASTSPSEVEAQKLVDRPTTAFRQTEPLGAGVILIRTPSCSKYLSCSATQIAAKAKLGTAVSMETSGRSFCWAFAGEGSPAKIRKTVTPIVRRANPDPLFITESPLFLHAWI